MSNFPLPPFRANVAMPVRAKPRAAQAHHSFPTLFASREHGECKMTMFDCISVTTGYTQRLNLIRQLDIFDTKCAVRMKSPIALFRTALGQAALVSTFAKRSLSHHSLRSRILITSVSSQLYIIHEEALVRRVSPVASSLSSSCKRSLTVFANARLIILYQETPLR